MGKGGSGRGVVEKGVMGKTPVLCVCGRHYLIVSFLVSSLAS